MAWLLSENMLGGFHFNDRRYADDDLTLGSIDPYQVFRIFHEIHFFEWETGQHADIAYMVDQSHNLKGKIEAMIQTVTMAQQLFAKAALVDACKLATHRRSAISSAPNLYCRMLSRPTFGPRSRSGAIPRDCRKIRWKHFGRADIWNASRKSAPRRIHITFPPMPSTLIKPYLAFDFGAESGRAVLAHLHSGVLTTEEVHRFANEPVEYGGSLHWDVAAPLA